MPFRKSRKEQFKKSSNNLRIQRRIVHYSCSKLKQKQKLNGIYREWRRNFNIDIDTLQIQQKKRNELSESKTGIAKVCPTKENYLVVSLFYCGMCFMMWNDYVQNEEKQCLHWLLDIGKLLVVRGTPSSRVNLLVNFLQFFHFVFYLFKIVSFVFG